MDQIKEVINEEIKTLQEIGKKKNDEVGIADFVIPMLFMMLEFKLEERADQIEASRADLTLVKGDANECY